MNYFLDADVCRIINNRSDKEMKEFNLTSYHVFEARVTLKIPPHMKFGVCCINFCHLDYYLMYEGYPSKKEILMSLIPLCGRTAVSPVHQKVDHKVSFTFTFTSTAY